MTHKNPSLRASSVVPEREASGRGKSAAPGKKPKPESMRVKKPPKKELEGNKWTIVMLPFLTYFKISIIC
jgi:adenylyl cyclase-associated protein